MHRHPLLLVLLAASLLLTAIAWLRSAEYDEQYTLFLTGEVARPIWPQHAFTAADVRALQASHASLATIAHDLRTTDVHPPLYFWLMRVWRGLFGPSLFAARLASVICGVATLGLVALIARQSGIPVVPAVLLTLGCYGFAYTSVIARGFALAQLLNVAGIACLLDVQYRRGRMLAGGALLGAATFTNYLAVFIGCAALLHALWTRRWRGGLAALIGFALWLPADLWFFLAQRSSRVGQFAPFEPLAALARLGFYAAANVFGGLPLYLGGNLRAAASVGLSLLLLGLLAIIGVRWHRIGTPGPRLRFLLCAVAQPIGLLLLGAVFGNTPIELRYLAFALPFVGLLLAGALPRRTRGVVLALQAAALIGLMLRPETMQPARAIATAATSLVGDGVVLLPSGNDGVGIVGAFSNEAPAGLRLLLVRRGEQPAQIRQRADGFPRVAVALIAQDAVSRAIVPTLRQAFIDPCWRPAGHELNVHAYDRICAKGCAACQ